MVITFDILVKNSFAHCHLYFLNSIQKQKFLPFPFLSIILTLPLPKFPFTTFLSLQLSLKRNLLQLLNSQNKLTQSKGNISSHLFPWFSCKVEGLHQMRVIVKSHWTLYSICIRHFQLSQGYSSSSRPLGFRNLKRTTIKSKRLIHFLNNFGKSPTPIVFPMWDGIGWTVEKSIFPLRMPMKIQENKNFVFFLEPSNKRFGEIDLRIKVFPDREKFPIEIFASCTGSTIAHYDSIRIQHRNDKKVCPFSYFRCLTTFSQKPLYKSF